MKYRGVIINRHRQQTDIIVVLCIKISEMRTLIVFNHPYDGSFCNALLMAAKRGAELCGECDIINLDKDKFNPVMSSHDLQAFVLARYEPERALAMIDKQVLAYKSMLEKAEHVAFIFPVWWMLMPALTKGFIDRVIFPLIAYDYAANGAMQSRLKNLKRVTVVTTMNTPAEIYEGTFGNALYKALFQGTFETIGVKNYHWISLDVVAQAEQRMRERWLERVEEYFSSETF